MAQPRDLAVTGIAVLSDIKNPWVATPERPPYVLPEDLPYVSSWNATRGSDGQKSDRVRLQVEILPEPATGPRDAPVVTLARNPGFDGREAIEQQNPKIAEALRANLTLGPRGGQQPYLTEVFRETAGGRWGRRCFRALKEASGLTYEDLAGRILSVEFHGYHSKDWAALPVTLPSQWYGFSLVEQALERNAFIIILRGHKDWLVAVPQLRHYSRCVVTNTARSASVSPRNLPVGMFDKILDAIRGTA